MKPRVLEVRTKILKKNDELARAMRADFARQGVYVSNFVSSPGSGKTEFLTKTLERFVTQYEVAAVVGDLATENDADRLATSGAVARQIQTDSVCHLEADMVSDSIRDWDIGKLDFLFIENVGNLVCPTSWDLGEDLRVMLLAVTEGEDKPLKYPTLINTSDVVVISKLDLAGPVEFNRKLALQNIQKVRPGIQVFETSAKTGEGMDAWIEFLKRRFNDKQSDKNISARQKATGKPLTALTSDAAERVSP